MKLLVVSDSHGSAFNLCKAARMHPDADYLIHAGDGAGDLDYVTEISATKRAVSGNCDIFDSNHFPMFESFKIDGIKIAVTHGHRLDVKYGLTRAEYYMQENEIDLLIFGHTHEPLERTFRIGDRLYCMFNPGSIREGSFGLITVIGDRVLMSHGKV